MVTTEKRKTFKFQMALACALFGLFLLVWFGLFNYYQASEMFKNNTLRYLDDIVARVAADLDEHILLRKQLLDKAAAEVSASELGNLSAHAFEVIERLKPLATLFNTFVVYDKNGQLLAATPGAEERLAKNLTDQVDLRLVKYQKQPQVSTSFISQKGTSLIFITVPLLAPHGKLVGWLGGILDLSTANLFRHLARQMAGEVGYIKVTALESNITLFQTQMSQLPASLSSLRGEESGGDIVASAPAPGNGDNLFSDNANMLTVQRPLTQAGWMVGAWLPKDEANQKFGRMTKNYFIFGILSILFIIPLCVWWIKRALSPLEVLKTQMETLKTEPQTELLPISEYQELQSVADVINRIWSEQPAVEARLIQREAFFRAINDASPFGLFVIAEDGVIDYINDACKRLGGKEGGEWLGRYWLDAVHPDDRARLRQLGREVFAG